MRHDVLILERLWFMAAGATAADSLLLAMLVPIGKRLPSDVDGLVLLLMGALVTVLLGALIWLMRARFFCSAVTS
jgi:hypothetical protein